MSLRRFPPRLLAALVLTFFAVSCIRQLPPGSGRPNIILIVTDDQNADTTAFMPALQSLMAAGTTFTRAYAPTPLCCPGRASILRGQYAHNHGVRSNDGLSGGFPEFLNSGAETSTLATWLQGGGYRTALLGKYFNAYPEGLVPPPGFSSPSERYVPPGWDEWYGLLDIPQNARNNPYAMYNYPINQNGRIVRYGGASEDYLTDVLSGLAVDFVKRSSSGPEPFFLYLAPTAPHEPAEAAPRHQGAFEGLQAPRPPSFNEADMSDKPAWLAGAPPLTVERVAEIDAFYRKQAQALLAVDEVISALLEALRAAGELESTYILFTADNGLHGGEHRLAKAKLTPYDASARVPLVVWGPSVTAGRTVDALTLLSDLAPTLTELVDAPTPAFVDGRSLAPWLGGGDAPEGRQQVLHEFWPREGFPADAPRGLPIPVYSALRSPEYLYTEYEYPDGRREQEFYDLIRDPFELENIASTADAALLSALSAKLAALRSCQAAACREVEDSSL